MACMQFGSFSCLGVAVADFRRIMSPLGWVFVLVAVDLPLRCLFASLPVGCVVWMGLSPCSLAAFLPFFARVPRLHCRLGSSPALLLEGLWSCPGIEFPNARAKALFCSFRPLGY